MAELVPHYNRQGSRIIYCRRCRRAIGTSPSNANFGSVTACAVCQAAEDGIDITAEQLEALKTVNLPNGLQIQESLLFLQEAQNKEAAENDPLAPNIEEKLGPTYWLKATTLRVVEKVRDKLASSLASQTLARTKKRKSIFTRSIEEELAEEDK